ncbi:MAG: zinc ribbon domain-containing protein [Prevotella sp.]|nr:zinc ribbon domain-containing protein [Prevotella sp.]
MDIDEQLNRLQSELDDQLSQFGLSNSQQERHTSGGRELNYCPECGTKVDAGTNFCPNCGSKLKEGASSYNDADKPNHWDDSRTDEGIIWTDTSELARKYGTSCDEVEALLMKFISDNEELGVEWHLLDMASRQHELGEATWMDYSDVLQKYISDKDITPGPHLSLFIIGGNDVIPQPAEANPCYEGSEWYDDNYQDHVYADFYYCFYGRLQLDFLDFRKARCNVARLPLETGEMETSLEEDLQAYFNLSNMVTEEGGIKIGRAVMTSFYDWIPASREMSRNLPTEHMDNEDHVVLDNMFLSPLIMEDMAEELSEMYYEKLSEADMLMFNLHGTCHPDYSGFYSSDLAFSIDMLQESNARIFNTVACWGGRYIRYSREQSMLLSAMHGRGVLLYSGACVPAWGKCQKFQSDSTWRINPAAYSETFMARFAEYECLGTMTAGEAFLKAKCDYYNSSRQIEEDELTLGTVLMFNLYGNPKLRTVPDVNAIAHIQEDDGSKHHCIPFRKMKRTVVMRSQKENGGTKSLLEEVRGRVDGNLRMIHDTITKQLYQQLGVEPRDLYSVEHFETTDAEGHPEKGYLYNYGKQEGVIRSQIRARLDENGRLLDAIQAK